MSKQFRDVHPKNLFEGWTVKTNKITDAIQAIYSLLVIVNALPLISIKLSGAKRVICQCNMEKYERVLLPNFTNENLW